MSSSPPAGEHPVQWVLLTSEPVAYRRRCRRCCRRLSCSGGSSKNISKHSRLDVPSKPANCAPFTPSPTPLVCFAVIAWRLLACSAGWTDIRPDAAAATVLEPILTEALAARLRHIKEPKALPPGSPTVADVMRGIARLGGHHKSNGPPGWRLLLDWPSRPLDVDRWLRRWEIQLLPAITREAFAGRGADRSRALPLRRHQIGDRAVLDLRPEEHRLRQRRVGVDGQAEVLGVGAHLQRQYRLGDELAGVDADDAGA